ncbi:MAG: protein kinase [Candidatus Schekmanbacteria bacterium]|nr:protein kinase [Candidatus Schekmanbacteria bacterium]
MSTPAIAEETATPDSLDAGAMGAAEIGRFLGSLELFSSLGADDRERLGRSLSARSFPAGATVIRRGDAGDSMYLVFDGMVEIPVVDEDGKEAFRAVLRRGDLFGEISVLTGLPRTADVTTLSPAVLLRITRAALFATIAEHPRVATVLTEILGQRLERGRWIRSVGNYVLTGELGRGRMGIVYGAVHRLLDRRVAIKMLPHSLMLRKDLRERFLNEAKCLAGLRHPNIVNVVDCEKAYSTLFIVMEHVEGRPLSSLLANGPLPVAKVRDILRQLLAALDHAHANGIIHRDVKPGNILVDDAGMVKLMDFGIAAGRTAAAAAAGAEPDSDPAASGTLGTPRYLSPEQLLGRDADARSDIYALGIVIFEMLTGKYPYSATTVAEVLACHLNEPLPEPRSLNPFVPEELNQLVLKATAKDPADRHQSCRELLACIEGKRTMIARDALTVRTVTFVYEPGIRKEAEGLVEDTIRSARAIPGLIVR